MRQSEFNREFGKSRKRFDIIFRSVAGVIVLGFIGIIVGWIFVGTAIYQAAAVVEEDGLKNVVENIWCGKDQKCL